MRTRIIDVAAWVAAAEGLTLAELLGEDCSVPLVRARFAVAWVAHHGLNQSVTVIGRVMKRDHTTICHAIRRAEKLRSTDPSFRRTTTMLLDRALERACWDHAA